MVSTTHDDITSLHRLNRPVPF